MPARTVSSPVPIYQLKITLRGSKPPIWRRFQVPGDAELDWLHGILQTVMGWYDAHLHMYSANGIRYSEPDEFDALGAFDPGTKDEARVQLRQIAPGAGAKFIYEYDFGDGWEHTVLVEKILQPDPDIDYPVCLAGRRACPPEDCGGMWSYYQLLDALRDPRHPEHAELLGWAGGPIDPEAFSVDTVNIRLAVFRNQPPPSKPRRSRYGM